MVASDPKSRTGEEEKKELQKMSVIRLFLSFQDILTAKDSCHANGGKVVQIAKGVDSILIVYGGSSIRRRCCFVFLTCDAKQGL